MKFYHKKKMLYLYMQGLSIRDLNLLKDSLIRDIFNLSNLKFQGTKTKQVINFEIEIHLELIKLVNYNISQYLII